jgi:hypothetical protein
LVSNFGSAVARIGGRRAAGTLQGESLPHFPDGVPFGFLGFPSLWPSRQKIRSALAPPADPNPPELPPSSSSNFFFFFFGYF